MQRFFGARPDLSEPTRSRWPYYLERYTKDWLERPLKQITPALLEQRRQAIAAEIERRFRKRRVPRSSAFVSPPG